MFKKLLPSLVLMLAGCATVPAVVHHRMGVTNFGAPELAVCNITSSLVCNTSAAQGNGTQGDQLWRVGGKFNDNFLFLSDLWTIPAGEYLCNPTGSTGGIGYCTGGGGGGGASLTTPNTWTATQTFPNGSLTLAQLASESACTVVANTSGSSASPSANSCQAFQAAMVAANAGTISDSPATGPLVAYSPTGWGSTVAVLDVTPNSAGTTICSLVAGSDKQDVILKNTGTAPLFITNQCSSDSTAANRFSIEANFMIPAGSQARATYVTTTSRWNLL